MDSQERAKRREGIARLVASGKSFAFVAQRYNVSLSVVRDACALYEVEEKNGSSHAQRKMRRKAIADMVKKGASHAETARHFGVSGSLVSDSCREFGVIAAHTVGTRTRHTQFAILKLLLDGKTQAEAARICNVSHTRVYQVVTLAREAGFKIPRERGKFTSQRCREDGAA